MITPTPHVLVSHILKPFHLSRYECDSHIYDTGMVAITKILNGKKMSYYSYLMFLNNIEQSLKLDTGVAERGLFSFSHNFFSNDDPPIFKNLSDTKKDIQVAKAFVKNI